MTKVMQCCVCVCVCVSPQKKKRVKNKGGDKKKGGQPAFTIETEPCESFFNIFDPPEVSDVTHTHTHTQRERERHAEGLYGSPRHRGKQSS